MPYDPEKESEEKKSVFPGPSVFGASLTLPTTKAVPRPVQPKETSDRYPLRVRVGIPNYLVHDGWHAIERVIRETCELQQTFQTLFSASLDADFSNYIFIRSAGRDRSDLFNFAFLQTQ